MQHTKEKEYDYALLQPATTFDTPPQLLSTCKLTAYEAQQKNHGYALNSKEERYVLVSYLPNNVKKDLQKIRESA